MNDQSIVHFLVDALQERETGLGQDDVAWAFESQQTQEAAIAWTVNHVNEATLLTEDEQKLYQWLRKTGSSVSTDTFVRPFLDSELQHTLRNLEASTVAIERQTRLLEGQKSALHQLQKQRRVVAGTAQDAKVKTRGQRLHEASRLGFTIEELEDEFKAQLEAMSADLNHAVQHLSSSTSHNMATHDQVLEAVAQLASRTRGTDFIIKPSELDAYCRRLIEFRTIEMQSRFDLLLQEQLIECAEGQQQHNIAYDPSDFDDLMVEIQTLKEEVANVMEVVVANDVRQPLLKSMRLTAQRSREEQTLWSEYIFSTINHMIAQTQVLHEHLSVLLDYDTAYRDIDVLYREPPTSKHDRKSIDVVVGSQNFGTHQRTQSRPLLTPSSSGSSVPLIGASAAGKARELTMSQILSRLNISSVVGCTDQALSTIALMEQAVRAASEKLSSQYDHALAADKATLATALTERDDEAAMIRDRLTVFSRFHNTQLIDQQIEQKVDQLDSDIQRTAKDYAATEASTRTSTACEGAGRLRDHYSR